MIVAGVIIETLPGCAADVATRLASVEAVTIHGSDGDRQLAAVWSASSADAFEDEAEHLLHADASIVGIFPTFVGHTDEADGTFVP